MLASVQGAWEWLATIPHLEALLLAAYVLYLLWIASWIVLQKREPVATLSWVLSLAALPYLGLLIYYWLGPQKVKRQRLRRGRSRSGMESYSSVCPPDADCTELAKIAQSTTGLAPSSATEVHWLVDGAATYAAIIEAIRGARDHIHLQYYIFQPDHSGTAICDALMERARAGVKVRLLMDAVGSSAMTRRSLRTLRAAGVETAWFHPSQLLKPFKRPWLNLRTHRKVVVVDGRIGFTGGINVTDEENEQVRSDARLGQRVEQGRLADIGQADDAAFDTHGFSSEWRIGNGEWQEQRPVHSLFPILYFFSVCRRFIASLKLPSIASGSTSMAASTAAPIAASSSRPARPSTQGTTRSL